MESSTSLHHVGLASKRFDETIRLYVEGLGFSVRHEWGREARVCMLDMGDGSCVEVFESDEELPSRGRWLHLALRSEDIEESYRRAVEAGAAPKLPPTYADIEEARPERVYMYFAYVVGPNGEEIEFIQELEGPAE